ncbi:MAG: nucleotidyltransferase family protein [Dehalococcoidia bacterium]|jgi:hypothetical protein|nr:nucleotidyltransferase family protein [Dehalococcoidia bacterium]
MLTNERVITLLESEMPTLRRRFSVQRIGLFGSVLRGTASDTSDVDILVELGQPTFDHYMDLKFFLEERFARTVDLVLADSLKPRLKPIVTREVAYAKG